MTAATLAPIELENVSFQYHHIPILQNISLQFPAQSVTALIGKSGSGKSTLLNLINGMLKPASGKVKLFNSRLDYDDIYTTRRKLGYVVQQGGLFPHLTVFKNISLAASIHQVPSGEIDARVDMLLNIVGLPLSYRSKYPHELSGGEQQRVGLCRALFLQPPILLMDEPFASLDTTTRQGLYSYFQKTQQEEPRTVILVTHQWEEAKQLANHFVWIDQGAVRATGDIQSIAAIENDYHNSL